MNIFFNASNSENFFLGRLKVCRSGFGSECRPPPKRFAADVPSAVEEIIPRKYDKFCWTSEAPYIRLHVSRSLPLSSGFPLSELRSHTATSVVRGPIYSAAACAVLITVLHQSNTSSLDLDLNLDLESACPISPDPRHFPAQARIAKSIFPLVRINVS